MTAFSSFGSKVDDNTSIVVRVVRVVFISAATVHIVSAFTPHQLFRGFTAKQAVIARATSKEATGTPLINASSPAPMFK